MKIAFVGIGRMGLPFARRVPIIGRISTVLPSALLALTFAAPFAGAHADSAGLIVGSYDQVNLYGLFYQWDAARPLFEVWPERLTWHVEFRGEYLHPHKEGERNYDLFALGATPNLRLTFDAAWLSPFVDAGIGIRLLNGRQLNTSRDLGACVLFGEFAGVGARFGPARQFALGLRAEHMSNADLAKKNNGLDTITLWFGYQLD